MPPLRVPHAVLTFSLSFLCGMTSNLDTTGAGPQCVVGRHLLSVKGWS